MASKGEQTAYRFLGQTRGFLEFDRQSLWLGPDEILSVTTQWARETNRRFPLDDIEGITIQGTTFGRLLSLFLLALTLSGIGLGVFYIQRGGTENDTLGSIGIFVGVVSLISLLINLALGKTCVARLYTAVHVEELKPLRRMRRARRFVRFVAPAVHQAQGTLPAERSALLAERPNAARLGAHARVSTVTSSPRSRFGAHRILAIVLVLVGLLSVTNFLVFAAGKIYVDFFAFGVAMTWGVVAGIQQTRSTLPGSVRFLPWVAFVLAGLGAVMALYVMSLNLAEIVGQQQAFSPVDPYRMISAMVGFVMLVMGGVGWIEVDQLARKLHRHNGVQSSAAGTTENA